MRYTELLFEDRTDSLAAKYQAGIAARMFPGQEHQVTLGVAASVVRRIMLRDPTPGKKYTDWILRKIISGDVLDEDLYKVEEYLKLYDRAKARLPQDKRDINHIADEKELFDLTEPFRNDEVAVSTRDERAALDKKMHEPDQSKLVLNDDEMKIIVPLTKEASCYFGRNTQWCTAAQNHNMFDSYKRNGPLYIILLKKENKRYQFQFSRDRNGGGQFMDERDHHIRMYDFIKDHPRIAEIFGEERFYADCLGLFLKNMTENQIANTLRSHPEWIESLTDRQQTPKRKLAAAQGAAAYKNLNAFTYIKKPWDEETETIYWKLRVEGGGVWFATLPANQRTDENLIEVFSKHPEDMSAPAAREYLKTSIVSSVVGKLPRALRYVPEDLRTFDMLIRAGADRWFDGFHYGGYVSRLMKYVKRSEWPSGWIANAIEHGEIKSMAGIPARWKTFDANGRLPYSADHIFSQLLDTYGPQAVPKKFWSRHMIQMANNEREEIRTRYMTPKGTKQRKDPNDPAHYIPTTSYSRDRHQDRQRAESARYNPVHAEDMKRRDDEMSKRNAELVAQRERRGW